MKKVLFIPLICMESDMETKDNLILVLVDLENLVLSMANYLPDAWPSVENALKLFKEWVEKKGRIYGLYAFAPLHMLFRYDVVLENLGFVQISCPKMPVTGEEKRDTTDDRIKIEGLKWIESVSGLTHVVLGSGDGGFEGMLEIAKKKGLKVAIAASSPASISDTLRRIADKDDSGKEMVYIFTLVSKRE